ncbi:MAG: hypothetical protein ACO1TE_05425 [Prosthecobacter sp.]
MCCFTGKVEEVTNTRIFARLNKAGDQVVIYQMALNAPQDLAMVLPVPIREGTGEDAVRFYDFSGYKAVFEDVGALFPMPAPTFLGGGPFAAAGYSSRALKVVSVGAYDASFVPTTADFKRLDARFRLPEDVWARLPGYADFGFAVFKLKAGRNEVHPMAFTFPSALKKTVFFPTLHIHDGEVHAKEVFDHTLYLQGTAANLARGGWRESPAPAVAKVQCGLTHGMIRPEMHVYRQTMRGTFDNGDVVVKMRVA